MVKDADGVVFVYNPSAGQDAELEEWYAAFNGTVRENQCIIFVHRPAGERPTKVKLPRTMEKITAAYTTMDPAEGPTVVRTEFSQFFGRVVDATLQRRETQEAAITG